MGKLLLLTVMSMIFCDSFVQAQQGPDLFENFLSYRKQLLQAAIRQTAAKATGTGSRLIQAFNGHGVSGGLIQNLDSTCYTYSGGRGGDLDSRAVPPWMNMPACDSMIEREWIPATGKYGIKHITRNTYKGANLLDSSMDYDFTNSHKPFLTVYSYTADGQVSKWVQMIKDSSAAAFWGVPYARMAITYTGTGSVSDWLYEIWDPGASAWTFQGSHTIVYNAAGQPRLEFLQQYIGTVNSVVDSVLYSYDALGNLITRLTKVYDYSSGTFRDLDRHRYYYNVFRIAETYEREYNGVLQREDSTTYQSAGAPSVSTITSYTWNAAGGGWELHDRNTLTEGANGKTETKLIEYANLGPFHYNDQRTFYFYNSFSQETREYSQSLVNGAWVIYPNNDIEKRYYYESFNTGVASAVPAAEPGIVLAPVPANDICTIALNFDILQEFSATIVDASGKTVTSWKGMAHGLFTRELDTRELPSGTYYLSVQGRNAKSSRAFTVQH